MRKSRKTHKLTGTTSGIGPDGFPMLRLGLERRLLHDAYHYLVSAGWPEVMLWIGMAFAGANAVFAFGYLITGGVANVRPGSFGDAFFFSVQTLTTIGYGTMAPRSEAANALVAVEAFCGGVGLALMTGLVFAKFSRPTSRVKFSKVAVIGNHLGRRCLMFRMANERAERIVQPQLYVVMLRAEPDDSGGNFVRVHDLELARDRHAFLSLTWLVIHPIDERSPLREATPESLRRDRITVIVSMVGIDEGLSQTVYAHHTYQPEEIRWNTRFVDVMRPRGTGGWLIDYSLFDDVVEPS